MRLNFKLILYIIGLLLIFNGCAMTVTALVSFIFNDGVVNEIVSSAAILLSTLFSALTVTFTIALVL